MKSNFWALFKAEKGQMLPGVLVLLVVGSLLLVPALGYLSTNLKTETVLEENVKGLYAANAGIEHALYRVNTEWADWASLDSTWTIDDNLVENGMNVNVKATIPATFLGAEIQSKSPNPPDIHTDWLSVTSVVTNQTYSPGVWLYTLTFTLKNLASMNIGIVKMSLGFDEGVSYRLNSTSCDSQPAYSDNPSPTRGGGEPLLLVWSKGGGSKKIFDVPKDTSVNFTFQVFGPEPDSQFPGGIMYYDAVTPESASMGTLIGNSQFSYFLLTSTANAVSDNEQQARISTYIMTENLVNSSGTIIGVNRIHVMDWSLTP